MLDQIKIIFEDEYLLAIDKPAGLIVHNPPGRNDPSVVDFIVRHIPQIKDLNWPDKTRPGIVHRLDKDTSGVMIIAKTPEIMQKLQDQFRERTTRKEYIALCYGYVKPEQGSVVAEIARHASKDKQTTIPENADNQLIDKLATGTIRPAQTDYETVNHYQYKKQPLTLILAKPKTGRMHQIRIHLKYINHPIIGDQMYFFKPSKRLSKELGIFRQFLHAKHLTFTHPATKQSITLSTFLASDLQEIINKIQEVQ